MSESTPKSSTPTMSQSKEVETKSHLTPLDPEFEKRFHRDAHIKFILGLDDKTDTFEYYVMEHLRMSGVYWVCSPISALSSMRSLRVCEVTYLIYNSSFLLSSLFVEYDRGLWPWPY